MAQQNRTTLKTYFNTGDMPTGAQFGDLIDSMLDILDNNTIEAEGQETVTTDTQAIVFSTPLSAPPTKITLTFWDTNGMPVSGGYDPASLTVNGFSVKVPGNAGETIICNYKAQI